MVPTQGRTAAVLMSVSPIFDGHNDVVSRLLADIRAGKSTSGTFRERGAEGHIDLPRAREGGFGGGLFSIYVPADPLAAPPAGPVLGEHNEKPVRFPRPLTLAYAQQTALAQLSLLFRLERESEGHLRIVRNAAELRASMAEQKVAAVIHFEGAEAIDPALDDLYVFHAMGLRSIGPVWSRPNDFGEGVPYLFPHSPDTGPGLTDRGKELVRACNRLGIVVDVSHINERGFWDIAQLTDAPIVATHSNAHALTPSPRNLTDRQLDAVKDSGGIVGVNFYVGFARADGGNQTD